MESSSHACSCELATGSPARACAAQNFLETVAGDGVADRECKEGEPEGQHDQIQHGDAPCDRPCVACASCRGAILMCINSGILDRCSICRRRHMFSRWSALRRYRNRIKMQARRWRLPATTP